MVNEHCNHSAALYTYICMRPWYYDRILSSLYHGTSTALVTRANCPSESCGWAVKLCVSVTSGRGQNHVWKLRGRGDLGHPAVVALQGPSHGHLLGHLGARYRSMAVD